MVEDQQRVDGFIQRLAQAFEDAPEPRGLMRRIADRCGVSEQAVGRWRRNGNVSRDHLAPLADELGVTTDWLLTGRGPALAAERDHARRVAPVVGDTVSGVDPARIGTDPAPGDPVVPVGYRGDASVYGVRVVDAPDVCPRYSAGEVLVVVAGGSLLAGFDAFVQWVEAGGVRAGVRHMAWAYDGEVALDTVVPVEGMNRKICMIEELVLCHPVYGVVAPWVVERAPS